MGRPRHSDKHIEKAVQYAEKLDWILEMSRGHAWGHLLCPQRSRDGCIIPVWSTPQSRENHARQIRRAVDNCPHCQCEDQESFPLETEKSGDDDERETV
jgi:hypothetical protein